MVAPSRVLLNPFHAGAPLGTCASAGAGGVLQIRGLRGNGGVAAVSSRAGPGRDVAVAVEPHGGDALGLGRVRSRELRFAVRVGADPREDVVAAEFEVARDLGDGDAAAASRERFLEDRDLRRGVGWGGWGGVGTVIVGPRRGRKDGSIRIALEDGVLGSGDASATR